MKLTKEQAALIRAYLLNQFPWLGNDPLAIDAEDEEPSGADVIEQLSEIYDSLEAV